MASLLGSTQDAEGHIYYNGQRVYEMTATGLRPSTTPDTPATATATTTITAVAAEVSAGISISAEQIAEIQARLPPSQVLWPDGTIRDRSSGAVVANLAFTGDVTADTCHDAGSFFEIIMRSKNKRTVELGQEDNWFDRVIFD